MPPSPSCTDRPSEQRRLHLWGSFSERHLSTPQFLEQFQKKGFWLRDHMGEQRQLCCEKRQNDFCLQQGAEPEGGSSILGQCIFLGNARETLGWDCTPEQKGQVKGGVGGCPWGPSAVWTLEIQTLGFPAARFLSTTSFTHLRFWAAKYHTDCLSSSGLSLLIVAKKSCSDSYQTLFAYKCKVPDYRKKSLSMVLL